MSKQIVNKSSFLYSKKKGNLKQWMSCEVNGHIEDMCHEKRTCHNLKVIVVVAFFPTLANVNDWMENEITAMPGR